jgi:hypothetical protein
MNKFNAIVMNPPYGKEHLKILKKCVENVEESGEIVSLQPIRWLQDTLWQYKKNSSAKKLEPILGDKIQSIEVITGPEMSKYFGTGDPHDAGFPFDCGIFQIYKYGGEYPYEELSNYRKNIDITNLKRILLNSKFDKLKIEKFKNQKNFVPISYIGGSPSWGDYPATHVVRTKYGYFIDGKNKNGLTLLEQKEAIPNSSNGKPEKWDVVVFDTGEEARNFYNSCETDFFRFSVLIHTVDVNISPKFLPFMEDYTSLWDDERYFDYFKISDSEKRVIRETMKKYS